MVEEKPDDVATLLDGDRDEHSRGKRLIAMWSGGALETSLPEEGRLVLGRGTDADLRLDHASVSRRHALMVIENGAVRLQDLDSANGTRIGGEPLARGDGAIVHPGTLIGLGSVIAVYHDDDMRAREATSPTTSGVIVADPQMQRVHHLVELAAKSSLSVILLGETGVGKEVLARRVHELSPRAEKAFLKINCAALVESLLEGELFGHERGAFTGAVQAKAGLLESAHSGTLFLDEIGELPLVTQAKLLRVLESGEVTRVGGIKPRAIDVRLVAATNRDLRQLVSLGKFRQDLFFRLDGVSIRIPPLRERVAEIPALVFAFLKEASAAANRGPPICVAEEAMASLIAHPWPGNVREMKNVIARTVLFSTSPVIRTPDLRFDALGHGAATAAPSIYEEAASSNTPTLRPRALPASGSDPSLQEERRRIVDALEQCVGNQTRAAKVLGISRNTLLKRLDALGFPRPRK